MRRVTTTLTALAAAAMLLTACADGGDPGTDPTSAASEEPTSQQPTSEEPTSEEPTSEEPTSEPTEDLEPFGDSTADQSSEQTEAALLLVDVRIAEHDGYDRLVLEFEGDGEPGWQVGYVESAATQGKGDPIELDGDAVLSVSALHTMPDDMTGYYDGPREIDADLSSIEEAFVDGTFEGHTVVVLGIDGPADGVPFRVFTLTEPSRLVVDVENVDSDD